MEKYFTASDRPQMTIRRMSIACSITKATSTHSEYVMLITFNLNGGCANDFQCYDIPILPVMLLLNSLSFSMRRSHCA